MTQAHTHSPAPIGDMPLTDFIDTVKFYRPSFGNPLGSMVMREAFPAFDPEPKDEEAAQRATNAMQEQMRAAKKGGAQRVFAVKGHTRRRFAGDFTLSRGSYYSVCNDEHGNDHGTLVGELSAYRVPALTGDIVVHDLVMPEQAELLHKHCDAPAGFVVELRPSEKGPNPVTLKLWQANLISLDQPTMGVVIFMPLAIALIEVPQVLDLRQLEAQQWITRFLPEGNDILSMPAARKVESFIEMLPSFMTADRGGSDLTDSIGFLLRKMGVNGLVFPSARSDVKCEFLNGRLHDYRGWNFVDYRGSRKDTPTMLADRRTDHSQWEDDLGEGVNCIFAPDDSPFAGSWRIEGLEATMEARLSNRLYGVPEILATGEQSSPRN